MTYIKLPERGKKLIDIYWSCILSKHYGPCFRICLAIISLMSISLSRQFSKNHSFDSALMPRGFPSNVTNGVKLTP